MPLTFIVGYWGCVFLDGKERRTAWRADSLASGSVVGLLISGDGSGDLRVFANGALVVVVEGALQEHVCGLCPELYPVVDVFAATLKVALQPTASPPPPPWASASEALSNLGSPEGSLASVPRSDSSAYR